MPRLWECDVSKVAVTKDELIPNWFATYEALKKSIQRSKNQNFGIKRLQRACKNKEMLIDFDTLDLEIQNALGDPRMVNSSLEYYYQEDGEARMYYTNEFRFENGERLKAEYVKEYTINASVLNALEAFKKYHIELRSKKDRKPKKVIPMLLELSNNFQEVLKIKFGYQHTLPSAERQFRTVFTNYILNESGKDYDSLISGRLQNENARALTNKTMQLLENLFAGTSSKPNKRKVHNKYQLFLDGLIEVINNDTGELYEPSDYKPLSERTVTNFLSSWTSKIGTYSKRSADRQKNMELFSTHRNMSLPIYAGTLLSIDDRQLPFEYDKSKRPWVYNAVDVASGAIVATVIDKDKEGIIMKFYRQLVRNYAHWGFRLPYELEAEVSLNNSFKDTLLRNGVMFGKVHLIANVARAKYIERVNKELRYTYEKDYPLWKGRPHAIDESSQPMNFDGLYTDEKYRTYESLVQQNYETITNYNNSPHSKKTELTKWQYFKQHQHPDLKPINWISILPYLGYATKTSCNRGMIRFNNDIYYIADNENYLFGRDLINVMQQIEGENVMIYWLDDVNGGVLKALVYINDEYICEAKQVPKYTRGALEQTEQDLINQQIQERYIASVESFRKERMSAIDKVTIIEHEKPQIEDAFVMPGMELPKKTSYSTGSIIETNDEIEQYQLPIRPTTQKSLLKSF